MTESADPNNRPASAAGDAPNHVYDRLRADLVNGAFPPGMKLKPQELKNALGCSAGVLREALVRLAGEGMVQFEAQRGFRTIVPTERAFYEIAHLRTLVEIEGARLSIQNGDMEWEANLSAAHHKLAHLEERMRCTDDLASMIEIWTRYESDFHRALIAACGSDLLKELHKQIFDKFRLYAVVEASSFGFRGAVTIREHQQVLEAALARDPVRCAQAIEAHFQIYRRRAAAQAKSH